MKTILTCLLTAVILLISSSLYAQVGIGTVTPDASAILDVFSDSKGLLIPRLTTFERDNITLPAVGLMIYNSTTNDGQLNIGTPAVPNWAGIKGQNDPVIISVTEGDNISTTSTSDLLVFGMTVSPPSGTYLVLFNGQHNTIPNTPTFSSDQGVIDMVAIYQTLTDMTGGTPHGDIFTDGEFLNPGVYDVAGATSIAPGTLTLDGQGDPNALFVIRCSGAITTGDNSVINLVNGASPNNIFWMSEGAISTSDGTLMKGNLVSPGGSISLEASTILEGRMLTKTGAVNIAANAKVTVPSGVSPVDLGLLSTFAMWSSSGAVSDVASSEIIGDVGTASGALTISGTHDGIQYPAGTIADTPPPPTATYSVYQNGIQVVDSSIAINSESAVVSLQANVTTLTAGEAIEIRWKVDANKAMLNNRIISLIRPEY
ncbi:MAG: hypothetical protein ACI86L_000798 [Dokdonia sp.]|jgi:hypothetical protein